MRNLRRQARLILDATVSRHRPKAGCDATRRRQGQVPPHMREDCVAPNDQGGASPLPGPLPTKGLRPLETSDLVPGRPSEAPGRGANQRTRAQARNLAARRPKSAVQGPVGPWRGGLEGQRPSNLRVHGLSPFEATSPNARSIWQTAVTCRCLPATRRASCGHAEFRDSHLSKADRDEMHSVRRVTMHAQTTFEALYVNTV
jgi:hypothetical protein